jgi:penicillin-binding protein-related factor A (putative recombinase)
MERLVRASVKPNASSPKAFCFALFVTRDSLPQHLLAAIMKYFTLDYTLNMTFTKQRSSYHLSFGRIYAFYEAANKVSMKISLQAQNQLQVHLQVNAIDLLPKINSFTYLECNI